MPFINGRFYINPAYGHALERARLAEAERHAAPQYHEQQQQQTGHWVTMDHRHVFIHERQVKSKPLPSSGQASIYADSFEGKKTANGATFHQNGYTAACFRVLGGRPCRLGRESNSHTEVTAW